MAALLDQLRQLHQDLQRLTDKDPEQEVTGIALPTIDYVVSEARRSLPEGSTLAEQIVEVVNPDLVAEEDPPPLRAADALLVVGQLLAVYEHHEKKKPNASISVARERLDAPRIKRRRF